MNFKRVLAFALAATMVLGSSITAFADTTGSSEVDGTGAIEYDDSKAVEYDSVIVPTLVANKYKFEVDPTGLLHEYDADTYEAGSVYFESVKTFASLVPKSGVTLYEKKKLVVDPKASTTDTWEGLVKTASTAAETGVITVTALADNLYVWTPKATAPTEFTEGTAGEWTALTSSNYTKWFKVTEPSSGTYELVRLSNYKAGTDVCDGNVYKEDYDAIASTGIVEARGSAVDVTEYATLAADGQSVSAYKNVYTRTGDAAPYTYDLLAADSADMVFTPEKVTKNNKTDSVDITNKSTRAKKVTAVVTLSNVGDLTFKTSDSYDSGEAATSVYFAATDGTNTVKLAKAEGATDAVATYEVEVPGKDTTTDVTYQTTDTNAAGGHIYKRYEAPYPAYNTNGFYIEASANTDAAAKAAWKTWAAGLTAQTKPDINIVYTVANVLSDDEQATADADSFKTTHATILAKTTETVEYDDLEAINAALTDYADLSTAAKALVTTQKALLDELKTAAEGKAITDQSAVLQYINSLNKWFVGDSTSVGLSASTFEISSIMMKKDNGEEVDVSSAASVYEFNGSYFIAVDYPAAAELGITYSAGSTYTVVAVVGNTRYTASKTY